MLNAQSKINEPDNTVKAQSGGGCGCGHRSVAKLTYSQRIAELAQRINKVNPTYKTQTQIFM